MVKRDPLVWLGLTAACAAVLASGSALDASVGLYDDGQYLEAATALTRVLQVGLADVKERTRARLYLASALQALHDNAKASSVLDDVVREDPGATVDPGSFPPVVIALFREAQLRAAPPPAPASGVQVAAPPPVASGAAGRWGAYAGGVADPLHAKVGAELGLAWGPSSRWWLEAGVVIAPRVGARFLVSRELVRFGAEVSLGAALRGVLTPSPAGAVAGGGVGLVAQWEVARHWALWGQGAAELYGTPAGALFSPLLTAGVLAHL
jgi:hypothetical protein